MIKKLHIFIILILTFFIINVNAEELEYISITKTSLHTYTNIINVGTGSCTDFIGSASYREITGSQGSYTFTPTTGYPLIISKLAYNVFGNFQTNKTYKIIWEANFPNDLELDDFSCSMGSYTNNTAFPPYSNTQCTVKRSDNNNIIMEGYITIQQGQYVTIIVTPKIGIDTNHAYCNNQLPKGITKAFTLSYGDPKVMLVKSQIDAINNQTNVIDNSINNVDDTINNSSIENPSSIFDDLNSKLATNNVISSLITLPITFYTNVLNGLNGSCSSFNLGNLLGTDIILPCINISNYLGTTLWNIIDILFSGFFILHMSKKFIAVFDNMSSMKDGDVIDD